MVKGIMDEKYRNLVAQKCYDEMTETELEYVNEMELQYFKPVIEKLRAEGTSDIKISGYLIDLFHEYRINDDVYIGEGVGISDDDWCEGHDWWWSEMSENPLMEI